MIQCDCRHQVFKLDTPATSYVCAIVDGGYLGHVYYGRKLEDTDLSYLLRTEEFPLVPSVNPREKVSFLDIFPIALYWGSCIRLSQTMLRDESHLLRLEGLQRFWYFWI